MWGQKKPRRPARGTRIEWTQTNFDRPARNSELVPEWKDPTAQAVSTNHAIPADYQSPPEVTDTLAQSLYIGGSVVAKCDLMLGDKGVYPFAALQRFYGSPGTPVPVPKGSLLMYAGAIPTVERKNFEGRKLDVRVFKHTFITPHGRCIIHDFALIRPA